MGVDQLIERRQESWMTTPLGSHEEIGSIIGLLQNIKIIFRNTCIESEILWLKKNRCKQKLILLRSYCTHTSRGPTVHTLVEVLLYTH